MSGCQHEWGNVFIRCTFGDALMPDINECPRCGEWIELDAVEVAAVIARTDGLIVEALAKQARKDSRE